MAEREYTVIAPDGKEVTLIGPVGASNDVVIAQAKKLYNSTPQNLGTPIYGDLPTAIGGKPNIIRYEKQPEQPKRTMVDYAKALYEVPTTVLSGAVAPFIGVGKGIVENIQQGTNNRVDRPELAQQFTYQPTSPVSQDVLGSMGEALSASKLPAYIPTVGNAARATQQAGRTTAPMVAGNLPSYDQVANTVKPAVNRLADALREPNVSTMSGVGAALVPDAQVRMARALNLPVPIKLSKGEALRELGQQQFEAEIAKTYPKDVGRPLIAGKMNRNEQLLQNFDAYVDATGAKEAGEFNLRQVGQVVDSALVNKANKAKKEIGDAYKLAREAGEDAELVDIRSVQNYLNDLEPESINAPVITSAKMKLDKLAKDGQISLNALEEVRKMVNTLSGDTTSNMAFGKQIKDQIDLTTVGKGGELYQKARKLRENYSKEFENVGYIDKLLSKKKGTSDRVVALEDVFKHSILDGSLDDVRSIGRTLKKAGSEGEQAWKELQGQTIEQMKSLVSKSVQRDELGNPIVSPAKFDGFVKQLDADGKLDYLFGKKGAQQIRDLRDATLDINVPMQGINQSNTSSAVTQALDRIKGRALNKLPLAGPLFEVGAEIIEKRKLAKEVDEALNFDPNNLAKELRKGK
jgi:hypothetical protein